MGFLFNTRNGKRTETFRGRRIEKGEKECRAGCGSSTSSFAFLACDAPHNRESECARYVAGGSGIVYRSLFTHTQPGSTSANRDGLIPASPHAPNRKKKNRKKNSGLSTNLRPKMNAQRCSHPRQQTTRSACPSPLRKNRKAGGTGLTHSRSTGHNTRELAMLPTWSFVLRYDPQLICSRGRPGSA